MTQKMVIEFKNFPTPGTYPRPPTKQFIKGFFSFGGLGMPGVCSKGMLGFSQI